jgi:hypothetical protein
MLGWIHEKMAIQESASGGGGFSVSNLTVARNNALTCNNPCALGEDCSTIARNDSWDITHTSNLSSRGERPSKELSALVQHKQHTGGSSDGQASHDTTSAIGWC